MSALLPPTIGAVPPGARRALWSVLALDVMVGVWMFSVGDWFDRCSPLTAVVTLGGHHGVVLALASTGFLALAVLAVVTGGFGVASRMQVGLLAAAVTVSIVAAGGVLSVALLVAGVALVVAVVGWGVLRRR